MERDSSTRKVKDILAVILKIKKYNKKYKLLFPFIREKEAC